MVEYLHFVIPNTHVYFQGNYSNKTHSIDCDACPKGLHQNQTGQTKCDPCEAGMETRYDVQFSRLVVIVENWKYQINGF